MAALLSSGAGEEDASTCRKKMRKQRHRRPCRPLVGFDKLAAFKRAIGFDGGGR